MAAKKNYYAVRKGRHPGIYHTWAECQHEVQGFPGASFKGFVYAKEAQEFLGGEAAADAPVPAQLPGPGCFVYVDGSYYQGRYSWAVAVYQDGVLQHTASGVGESREAAQLHNVAGEVEAAMQAVRWAEQAGQESIVICHDYLGISEWAEGRWKTNTPLTKAYHAFMQPYLGRVRFQKVAGHTGVAGNELADRLAKKALGI